MKTRKLLREMITVMAVAAFTVLPTGCGSLIGNDPIPAFSAPDAPDVPMGCTMSDATTMIAVNHPHGPHVVMVSMVDVMAGADKTYSLLGMASHDHTITVSASDFATLQAGGTIMTTSTTTAEHSHVVTISCG